MTDQPDILLLILDSARRDRVSVYGHEPGTTPTLESLATEATVFENAYTPTPWTLPSHCSMFTGKFPSEHGVTNGFADRRPVLPSSETTLTEQLAADGYQTAGFSNNPWVGQLSGLDRGFDEFVEWDLEIQRSSESGIHARHHRLYSRAHSLLGQAARQPLFLLKRPFFTDNLVDRAKRWVETTAEEDGPTFTFLNLMEAHSPYFPPGWAFDELGTESPGPIEPRLLNTRLLAYVLGKTDLAGEDRRRVMEYYDAALRYEDAKVAELLETYRELGLFEDTLVVVCSDHGKTLGDVPRDGHPSHYLRDHNANVPLLVKTPGQARSERVSDPVELVDLFDVMRNPPTGSAADAMAREHALTQDHIPHTGTTQAAVDRWHVVSGCEYRYARSVEGEEYLFERGSSVLDERVVENPRTARPSVTEELSTALDERYRSLDEQSERGDADETIDGTLHSQLEDLGYL